MWQFEGDFSPPADSLPPGDGCSASDVLDWTPVLTRQGVARACAYLPESCSENYAYPLVCYLHRNGRSEQDLERWFPLVSANSYLALGVRAPFPHRRALPRQYRWIARRPDASRGVIEEAVEMLAESHTFHADRINLLGEGEGALAALQQFLISQNDPTSSGVRFAGVICHDLPACWPRLLPPLDGRARGRILLLDGISSGEMLAAVDGLREAGVEVSLGEELSQQPEKTIDHWLMSAIPTAVW